MKKLLCLSLASTLLVNCETNQPSKTNKVIEQTQNNLLKQNSEESSLEVTGKQVEVNFKPLPLFMPTFQIKNNGEVKMTNVFETMENQIQKIQEKMKNQHVNLLQNMLKNKIHMKKVIGKHIKMTNNDGNMMIQMSYSQQPLRGADNHDLWNDQLRNNQINNQPLIGGDGHDLWNDQLNNINQPLIGGDDHDLWIDQLRNDQTQNQPLIGGDHDFWNKQLRKDQFWRPSILGDDQHDNWEQKKQQVKIVQNKMNLIGVDNDDYWLEKRSQQNQQNNEINFPENIILSGQTDTDNHHHDSDIMLGSRKDNEGKKSIDNIINGVLNFVKGLKKSKTEQKNQINDIQETVNQNVEKETSNSKKLQVLIK